MILSKTHNILHSKSGSEIKRYENYSTHKISHTEFISVHNLMKYDGLYLFEFIIY